jgi:hypothetical protein
MPQFPDPRARPADPMIASAPSWSPLPSSPVDRPPEEPRERAMRLLTDAYAYDVIDEAEFERRLAQLSAATSPRAIDALVADLDTSAAGARGITPTPEEGRILAIMSDTKRRGPWRVPRQLSVVAIMSSVRIDLRNAAVPDGCRIDVHAFMANVSIIVPPGLAVECDAMPIMASVCNHAAGADAEGYRAAHIEVHGSAVMAELRVRVRAPDR